ncbi:ferredoxin [Nocardia aurea]|uniref:ferredoxin n=1 Tax=Nocardia aurea TaxID=2144174 RepID=UPI000D69F98E|nr:ferredoxin [Nocardia aurea]
MDRVHAANLLEIDQSKCCGYGICAEVSPEIFSLDGDGFVVAAMPEIPDELLTSAEVAAQSCPEGVLQIRRNRA